MRVILDSFNRVKIPNYTVYQNTEQVSADIKTIDVLVIYNFTQETGKVGIMLSEAKAAGVKKYIYINEKPNELIAGCIKSLGGIVLTDEDFLDEDTIESMLEDYEDYTEGTLEETSASLGVINTFLQDFLDKSEVVNNKIYLDRVSTAITEVKTSSEQTALTVQEMSTEALRIFNNLGNSLNEGRELRLSLEKTVANLKNEIKSIPSNTTSSTTGTNHYQTTTYSGTKPLLYIKERQNCWYLLSFLIAYQNYLSQKKNVRLKVIVYYQKLKNNAERYKNLTTIDAETCKTEALAKSYIIGTTQPRKEVLDKILYREDADVIIVLDRMYGEELLKGTNIKTMYATSSVRALVDAKLPIDRTILPITGAEKTKICIPHIQPYAGDTNMRISAYYRTCEPFYIELNKALGID